MNALDFIHLLRSQIEHSTHHAWDDIEAAGDITHPRDKEAELEIYPFEGVRLVITVKEVK